MKKDQAGTLEKEIHRIIEIKSTVNIIIHLINRLKSILDT